MRKFKRIHNRQFGICLLAFTLVISIGGINKTRNAEAEENIPERIIEYQITEKNTTIPSRSIYIESENTLNIVPEYQEPVRPDYDINLDEKYQSLTWNLCLKNDLSYELALSAFHKESNFKLDAINTSNQDKSTDVGVSQLNSYYMETHREYAVRYCNLPENVKFNPMNPDHNIRAGIGHLVYLRDYWKQKGVSEESMLDYICNSYNLGAYGFQKYIERTGKIEREYSRQVLKRKIKLESTHTL